ncbi:MAG: glycosyltransferase family 39 protein [Candidatus Levybacteria bacterium]|nr:glycosyltransferase family 39 protein [Candidatus Levybacteria bacterium]
MNWKKEILISFLVPIIYLISAFITIGNYGISFDEPAHFRRGQAYLHYFLTGKKDYSNLPQDYRMSFYQDTNEDGRFYVDAKELQSHPPVNDTLAALGNYVLFQKLGIVDDVGSHHVFGIICVSVLILSVYLFTRLNYGIFAGFIAALSIFLYPLFLGESHFNLKDPPQATFFALTIIFFWFGIVKKSAKSILASALFCALALGTKFNVVFLPLILGPWLLSMGKKILKFPARIYWALGFFPLIVLSVFFLTNPNLWDDTWNRIVTMVRFYLSVGTNAGGSPNNQPEFLKFGFNTYPILAILYSVPLVTLFFTVLGIFFVLKNIKRDKTELLVFLWFLVPIIRVTLPGFTIYGGIRHIFEFVPAMGILAGIGGSFFARLVFDFVNTNFKKIDRKIVSSSIKLVIILLFVPITIKLISIHPNENVYFNPLIGGLRGAVEKDFPSSGASLGNTYQQGVVWVNKYAEKNACLATPIGIMGNIAKPKLRNDLRYHNTCQSGVERKGEYAMDMVYKDYFNDIYAYKYYPTYLFPVYEVKVDGVVIFQIFKNDKNYSKESLIREEEIEIEKIIEENGIITITLPKKIILAAVVFDYTLEKTCNPISSGIVLTSVDGKTWSREHDDITVAHGRRNFVPSDQKIERRFTAVLARYISFQTDLKKDCLASFKNTRVLYHPDTYPY